MEKQIAELPTLAPPPPPQTDEETLSAIYEQLFEYTPPPRMKSLPPFCSPAKMRSGCRWRMEPQTRVAALKLLVQIDN